MSRRNKDWIAAFLQHTENTEYPDSFRLWGAIGAISGALQRKVWLSQGLFNWYPNFYIFLVAPSGRVSKTTSNRNAMSILREVEGVKFGPRAATWQGLVKRLSEGSELFPIAGSGLDSEYITQTPLIIEAGELGTFLNPHDREAIDTYVDLYDCPEGAWEKWTKVSGDETVVNPCLTIVGATTPAWIAENCSTYFIEGGFASRSIFVYEEKKRQLVAYPGHKKRVTDDDLRQSLIVDLKQINSIIGQYEMSPGAVEWGEDWYKKHNTDSHPFWDNDRFGGYMSRKQSHIHKLAMVRAASIKDERVITEKELMWAEAEITSLEKFLPLVYGKVDQDRESRHAAQLMMKVLSMQRVQKHVLLQHFAGQMTMASFDAALSTLQTAQMIRLVQDGEGELWIEYAGDEPSLMRMRGG